jgi:hypothetical protein
MAGSVSTTLRTPMTPDVWNAQQSIDSRVAGKSKHCPNPSTVELAAVGGGGEPALQAKGGAGGAARRLRAGNCREARCCSCWACDRILRIGWTRKILSRLLLQASACAFCSVCSRSHSSRPSGVRWGVQPSARSALSRRCCSSAVQIEDVTSKQSATIRSFSIRSALPSQALSRV